jgi:hypothetical protein
LYYGALYNNGQQPSVDHASLKRVCPQHSLHTTLQEKTNYNRNWKVIRIY